MCVQVCLRVCVWYVCSCASFCVCTEAPLCSSLSLCLVPVGQDIPASSVILLFLPSIVLRFTSSWGHTQLFM